MNTRPDLDTSYSLCPFLYAQCLCGERVLKIAARSIVWHTNLRIPFHEIGNIEETCQFTWGNPEPVLISALVPDIPVTQHGFSLYVPPLNSQRYRV